MKDKIGFKTKNNIRSSYKPYPKEPIANTAVDITAPINVANTVGTNGMPFS